MNNRSGLLSLFLLALITRHADAQLKPTDKASRPSKANAPRWQVTPDPVSPDDFSASRITEVDILLSDSLGDLLVPSTPSYFVGYLTRGAKTNLTIWDLRTGERSGSLVLDRQIILPPALSPDGAFVAIAHVGAQPKVEIWSLAEQKLLREIDLGEPLPTVQLLQFAGRDRLLIETASGQGPRIFDAHAGTEVSRVPLAPARSRPVAVSSGGRYAALENYRLVQLYDLKNGAPLNDLPFTTSADGKLKIQAIQFSPNGNELAALSASQPSQLLCWSLQTGKLILEHKLSNSAELLSARDSDQRNALDFIPGNKGWLFLGRALLGRNGTGPLWLPRSNLPIANRSPRIVLDEHRVLQIQGDYNQCKLTIANLPWDEFNKQTALATLGVVASDTSLPPLTTPDRTTIREISNRGEFLAWNVPSDAAAAPPQPLRKSISVPLSSLDQRALHLSGPSANKVLIPKLATQTSTSGSPILDLQRYSLVSGKGDGLVSPPYPFELLDFASGGRHVLLTTSNRERLDIFDLDTGSHVLGMRPFYTLPPTERRISAALLLPGDRLLTQNALGLMECWSLPTCRALYSFPALPAQQLIDSPNRKYAFVIAEQRYCLINLDSGEVGGTLQRPNLPDDAQLRAAAFHPGGKSLAGIFSSAAATRLVAWNLDTGKLISEVAIAPADNLTWLSETTLLTHLPRGSNAAARYRFIDLVKKHAVWEYQLPRGCLSPHSLDGKSWYLAYDDGSSTAELVAHDLPASSTIAAMEKAPQPKNLVARGALLALRLLYLGIDGKSPAPARTAEFQKLIANRFSTRGLRIRDGAPYTLTVTLDERLNKAATPLPSIELHCRVVLANGESPPIWSRDHVLKSRSDSVPRAKPTSSTSLDGIRQQLADAALAWLANDALPTEIYPSWTLAGIGESTLGVTGETNAQLKPPAED